MHSSYPVWAQSAAQDYTSDDSRSHAAVAWHGCSNSSAAALGLGLSREAAQQLSEAERQLSQLEGMVGSSKHSGQLQDQPPTRGKHGRKQRGREAGRLTRGHARGDAEAGSSSGAERAEVDHLVASALRASRMEAEGRWGVAAGNF